MGITTAFRTTPYLGWFFCLHQALYTYPVLVIKTTRPKLSQLWSRTHWPCESQLPSIDSMWDEGHWHTQWIPQRQPRRGVSKGRYDGQSHFSLKGSESFPCLKTADSIRATRSITSTITSRARSSITLTLFTRSLSVDGRAAASMQTDLIQLLLSIPLAEATSQINDGGDESTALTANNQPVIKNLFTTHLD